MKDTLREVKVGSLEKKSGYFYYIQMRGKFQTGLQDIGWEFGKKTKCKQEKKDGIRLASRSSRKKNRIWEYLVTGVQLIKSKRSLMSLTVQMEMPTYLVINFDVNLNIYENELL